MATGNGQPDAGNTQDKAELKPDLGVELGCFLQQIDALAACLPLLALLMYAHRAASADKHRTFLREKGTLLKDNGAHESYNLNGIHFREASKLQRIATHAEVGSRILPTSFLVALVSQYDFFLSRLIRALLFLQPERLNASDKQITFKDLLGYGSIEQAREHILEKEIESVLRKSHAEQFKWMEQRFEIDLSKDLPIWPAFIEVTERRNLFVHCDGVVSSQYRSVCTDHGADKKTLPATGTKLDVEPEYFAHAHSCIFEIGVKLAHVLWRKVSPGDRAEADLHINNIVYELVIDEKYKLAITLGTFAIKYLFRKGSEDRTRRMVVINLAQAYKWSGEHEQAKMLLEVDDWSACDSSFQMALLVLSDQFESAVRLMKAMGKEASNIGQLGYREWPVFREFRKSEGFLRTYEDILGCTFSSVQEATSMQPVESSRNAISSAIENLVQDARFQDYVI